METDKRQSLPGNEDISKELPREITKDKIHRHLTDINDTISEEDIIDINTDFSTTGEKGAENAEIDKSTDDLKKDDGKDARDTDTIVPNPWDVLR